MSLFSFMLVLQLEEDKKKAIPTLRNGSVLLGYAMLLLD
jgi:hypothetical protein